MLDRDVIQGRGFRNVVENGQITGFQFDLRNPNYRGVAGSLLDGIDITVDGQEVPEDVPQWTLQGRTFTLDELRRSTDVRWQLDELATITVRSPGGLRAGVHDISVLVHLRRPYFPPAVARSAFPATGKRVIVPPVPAGKLGYCVSTYSYSGDMFTSMTLEDALADVADFNATGIEILGEGNIPAYPTPDAAWVDHWHTLLAKYGVTPTNYGSWVDTTLWGDRELTAEEGAAQIQLDLRLAKRLGFTSIRPKFGIISFELEPHPIWREAVKRSLDLAQELDVIICPEIHAPTPIKDPVTHAYIDLIDETKSDHFKLLIDTGIFQTAPVDDPHEGVQLEEGEERPAFLEPLAVPISDLIDILPHVHFIQAKFFEIDDQLHDLHVPWGELMPALTAAGWTGWLSSEYEGRRELGRGRDQVRRQHALLRTLQATTGE